jgi:nucleoside-diphosphate-sugar epimerase
MRVLVTGSAGFVGQALVKRLAGMAEVCCLYNNTETKDSRVKSIKVSLDDVFDQSALPQSVDIIIHLAQSNNYRLFPEKSKEIFFVNTAATMQLLEYARKAGCSLFISASTGAVYGKETAGKAFKESASLNPGDFYSVTKLMAEQLVASYRDYFSTIILRPFFIYGPGQKEKLIPNLINSIKSGKPVLIRGNKGIVINPIFIDDVIEIILRSMELSGQHVLNVAGREEVSLIQIVGRLEELLGIKAVIKVQECGEQEYLLGDITLMSEILNYTPRVSLYEGLLKAVGEAI